MVTFEMVLEYVNSSKSSLYGKMHSVMYTFRARHFEKQNCNIKRSPTLGNIILDETLHILPFDSSRGSHSTLEHPQSK